jgi:imidazolonepropionase-like amidohydrolase
MTEAAVAIVGSRVVPISGAPLDSGTILVADGKITAVGPDLDIPDDAKVIDAAGGWVLPGFIEAHGHVGVHEEAEAGRGLTAMS